MASALDLLEDRVNAVADLVQGLRREISRLERELADRPAAPAPPAPAAQTALAGPECAASDKRLLEELARLRAERAAVRERISGLIREIDQVAW